MRVSIGPADPPLWAWARAPPDLSENLVLADDCRVQPARYPEQVVGRIRPFQRVAVLIGETVWDLERLREGGFGGLSCFG